MNRGGKKQHGKNPKMRANNRKLFRARNLATLLLLLLLGTVPRAHLWLPENQRHERAAVVPGIRDQALPELPAGGGRSAAGAASAGEWGVGLIVLWRRGGPRQGLWGTLCVLFRLKRKDRCRFSASLRMF